MPQHSLVHSSTCNIFLQTALRATYRASKIFPWLRNAKLMIESLTNELAKSKSTSSHLFLASTHQEHPRKNTHTITGTHTHECTRNAHPHKCKSTFLHPQENGLGSQQKYNLKLKLTKNFPRTYEI